MSNPHCPKCGTELRLIPDGRKVTLKCPKCRGNKYNAQPVVADGFRFDSTAEGGRWSELRILERASHIWDLQRQVRFPLCVGGTRIGLYVADFVYTTSPDSKALVHTPGAPWPGLADGAVVEDVKGVRTALYSWKSKHFAAQYGIPIVEVKA